MGRHVVLFDLDGTLIDSHRGIALSIQHALAQFSIHEPDLDRLARFIGPPLGESFAEHYGFDEETTWRAVEHYRHYFAATGIHENTVYPGIPELLRELREQGVALAIATSKLTIFAEEILRRHDLARFFQAVAGSSATGTGTSKADVIRVALTKVLDGDSRAPQRSVMVGDHPLDVLGARANGIDAIAVTYGYGPAEALRAVGPAWMAASVPALRTILLAGMAGRSPS